MSVKNRAKRWVCLNAKIDDDDRLAEAENRTYLALASLVNRLVFVLTGQFRYDRPWYINQGELTERPNVTVLKTVVR